MKTVVVTGGAGYIGSHTTLLLLEAGFEVVVVDNLCNSSPKSLEIVASISGKTPIFAKGDIRDQAFLDSLFSDHKTDAVLHFAGLKAVADSTREPIHYYSNNVAGTLNLCQSMQKAGIYQLIFSSSATVYGEQPNLPFHEDMPTGSPTNPYGRSKLMIEEILRDTALSDGRWRIAFLRYFNPIGAHESGLMGEDPLGTPNNLLPYIAQVAIGRRDKLSIFGDDYPTIDGTGVRDYIHVMDLAEGHMAALGACEYKSGVHIWNLGTGRGVSVLQMVRAFETATGQKIPFTVAKRRPGDIAECWADTSKAKIELEWQAKRGLEDMMRDTWRWQLNNPNGFN